MGAEAGCSRVAAAWPFPSCRAKSRARAMEHQAETIAAAAECLAGPREPGEQVAKIGRAHV